MQSGISASQELLNTFQSVVSDTGCRGLIVSIEKESLVPKQTLRVQGSFEDDLSQLDDILKDNEAAYIILRKRDSGAAPFIAVAYVPDSANVRQKMLFASTRNSLLRELGTERFGESLFATTKAELTAEGFKKHADHGAKPPPLTEEERLLKEVKDMEAAASRGGSTKKEISSRVQMPLSDDALEALKSLGTGESTTTLVQLAVDTEKESIYLDQISETDADGLASAISDTSPRYSFFLFKHSRNGNDYQPLVFIYTCPPSSKIKERMMYAATRRTVEIMADQLAGLKIEKKIEAASADEISLDSLLEEFHPKQQQTMAFARPKRPGRR